ncbi:MAG: response regulator transcription factor [Planctomycetota bacterium]
MTPDLRALIIDDDSDFLVFISTSLDEAGVDHVTAPNAEEGLRILDDEASGTFDIVLLDVTMPGRSGWDVLMEVREKGNEVPVIFVTSLAMVEQRVKGLELGADDYLVKPFEFEELIARMNAVIRRRNSLAPIDYGDVHLDLVRRKVKRAGNAIDLTPREYDLLVALVRADGEVLSREDLLREVWDIDFNPGTNAVDVHLGRLRKKLDRHGRMLIETVWGEGYRIRRAEPTQS